MSGESVLTPDNTVSPLQEHEGPVEARILPFYAGCLSNPMSSRRWSFPAPRRSAIHLRLKQLCKLMCMKSFLWTRESLTTEHFACAESARELSSVRFTSILIFTTNGEMARRDMELMEIEEDEADNRDYWRSRLDSMRPPWNIHRLCAFK